MMLQYYPDFAWTPLRQAGLNRLSQARRRAALQCRQFRFQFGDPRIARGQRRRHIGGVEFLRDMLRAIGVPGRDLEQDHLLGPRLVALRHQRLQQRRIVVDHARLAPDLHAAAMRIIHQEICALRFSAEVALGDVLPVAAVVGERQRVLVQHPDETFRAAAMLDIGLAVGAGGREDTGCWRRRGRRRGCRRSRCASRRSASTRA